MTELLIQNNPTQMFTVELPLLNGTPKVKGVLQDIYVFIFLKMSVDGEKRKWNIEINLSKGGKNLNYEYSEVGYSHLLKPFIRIC